MIQQATKRSYSGVVCRHCRAPIPVPAIVIRIESASQSGDPEANRSERVFTLRCRACDAENPYRSSQIVEIEGEPKERRFSARPVDAEQSFPLTRTAHA
jgi:ribosomal protein L40E